MEKNLHINERLEKQKVAEYFAKRGTIPADDKKAQDDLVNVLVSELVMNTVYISPVTLSGEESAREVSFRMVKSPQGENFFPVFTSSEDLEKWDEVNDADTIQLTFDDYAIMLNNNGSSLGGIAINPFSDNFRVDRRLVAQWYQSKQMTVQGHANNVITKDTKYEIYVPEPYPAELSEKLSETAKGIPEVKRLWLRGITMEGREGYLVVADFDSGDKQKLIPVLGEAGRELLGGKLLHFVTVGTPFADDAVKDLLPIYNKDA